MGSVVKGATISVGYKYNLIEKGKKILDGCVKLKNIQEKCSFQRLGYLNDIKALEKLKMIVLAGVCGDLCVMDFGRTLLRYLDEINHDLKVFVVKSCIDTFDAPGHNREEWLEIAYKVLEQAGAIVVEDVEDLKGKVKQLIK